MRPLRPMRPPDAPAAAPRWAAAAVAGGLAALTAWRLAGLALGDLTLTFDEAQYWTWAKAPAFGYYSKPPLIAWILAAATGVCGDGEACIRAASPLLHLATAAVIGLLARRLFDGPTGLAAAALYATLPGVSFSSLLMTTDAPLLLFWALAALFLHRALDGGRWTDWIALGLALGFGLLAKYTMVLFLPCAALFLALSPGRRWRSPRPLAALATALAVAAPNLAWNAAHGFATLGHVVDNANLGGAGPHPDRLAAFLGAQFAVFGPLTFAVLLWLAARWRRTAAESPAALYLLCLSAPVLALFAVQALLSRAHANWAAAAYVAGAVLAARWFVAGARRRTFAAALALHLAAVPALLHYDALIGGGAWDPFRRMRGWDDVGAYVSRLAAENPGAAILADERKTIAQLMYYVRPHPFDAVKWNPGGRVGDHYELTTDIEAAAHRPMLLVTRRPDPEAIARSFAAARPLGAVESGPRRFDVYRLDGFLGYAEDS